MNIEHLITMANQIGTFFKSYPDAYQTFLGLTNAFAVN
jgi:hypothetical protein